MRIVMVGPDMLLSLLTQQADTARQRVWATSTSAAEFSAGLAALSAERWRADRGSYASGIATTPCVVRALAGTAVRGFDPQVRGKRPASVLAPIPHLVERIARTSRQGLSAREVVEQVRAAELRRLARLERLLVAALRRLLERVPARTAQVGLHPSKAATAFRLPLTGAQTLTAPPAA